MLYGAEVSVFFWDKYKTVWPACRIVDVKLVVHDLTSRVLKVNRNFLYLTYYSAKMNSQSLLGLLRRKVFCWVARTNVQDFPDWSWLSWSLTLVL